MKIDYVVTGLDVGGAEVQVRDLAIGMKARGHDVSVTTLLPPKAYVDQLEAAGVIVRTLGISRQTPDFRAVLLAAFRLRRLVAIRRPEIVHSHMVHANLFARLALALSGNRLICTIHNIHEGGRARDLAYALTNWAAALNTTISEAATARFVNAHVLPKNTITIYNGVDISRFSGVSDTNEPAGRFRWIAIGRLELQKDYPTLLSAMVHLPSATLDIAGDGILRKDLVALAQELGIADRVTFLGVRNDIPDLLRQHDGYVLSSAWEGFGIAVVEAMASGLPVVVTDSGGPAEIVGRDGAAGIVVPASDAIALTAAMKTIVSLPEASRRGMGGSGRRRALAAFDLELVLGKWSKSTLAVV